MFKNLLDFSFKRNWRQAVGFYLVYAGITYLLIGIIIAVFAHLQYPSAVHPSTLAEAYTAGIKIGDEFAHRVGPRINFAMTALFLYLIVSAKKNYSAQATGCALLALFLSLGAVMFSFIPVAYLTTLPNKAAPPKAGR